MSDFEIFNRGETVKHFRENGYQLSEYEIQEGVERGYVKMTFNKFYIEVWGRPAVTNTQYLPRNYKNMQRSPQPTFGVSGLIRRLVLVCKQEIDMEEKSYNTHSPGSN